VPVCWRLQRCREAAEWRGGWSTVATASCRSSRVHCWRTACGDTASTFNSRSTSPAHGSPRGTSECVRSRSTDGFRGAGGKFGARQVDYGVLAAPPLDTRPCISRFALGLGFVCRKVTTSSMLTQRSCCLLQRLSAAGPSLGSELA